MSFVPPTLVESPPPTPQLIVTPVSTPEIIVGDAPGPQGPPGTLAAASNTTPAAILTAGTAGTAGVQATYSRSDHSHPIVGVGTLAGTNTWSAAQLYTAPQTIDLASSALALTVQGAPAQGTDLTQWQNSSGNVLARIDSAGRFGFGIAPLSPHHTYTPSGTGNNLWIGDADNGSAPALFALSKFNSQGVAWSSFTADPSIILQGSASGRPEISWYRGGRTYPQASVRESAGADVGGELWAGTGLVAPTLAVTWLSSQVQFFANRAVIDSSGRVGVGANINTNMLLAVGGAGSHPGTGTNVYGISVDAAAPLTATSATTGYHGRYRTLASAYTVTNAYAYIADTPSVGAGSTVTNAHGVRIENQGAAGVVNAFGLFVAAQANASTNNLPIVIGNVNTFTVDNNGSIGIGGTSTINTLINMDTRLHPGTATTIYGTYSNFIIPTTATTNIHYHYAQGRTTAAAFSSGAVSKFTAAGWSVVGAGSTITTSRGFWAQNQGAAGVTNAYGMWIDTQANASNLNLPLVIGAAATFSIDNDGRITIGGASGINNALITLSTAVHPSASVNTVGIDAQHTVPTTSTTTAYMIRTAPRLQAAGALGTVTGFRADAPVPSTATVTSMNGIQIVNQGFANATNAYGLFVFGQSGASTLNTGVAIQSSTTAALWLGQDAATTTVSGGITFGSARDVSLFRFGAGGLMIDAATGTVMRVNGPAGQNRQLGFSSAGTNRWRILTNTAAETGANAGSDFSIDAFDDAGASIIFTPFKVTRSTGLVSMVDGNHQIDAQGRMGVGGVSAPDRMINMGTGLHPNTTVSTYHIICQMTMPSTTTTAGYGVYTQPRTQAAAFTMSQYYGYYVAAGNIGAGSAITTLAGFSTANLGATGIANAYGVLINAISGASTLNVGIRVDTATTAALWLGGDAAGISASGGIVFGSARDVNLYRGSGAFLQSDSNVRFQAGSGIQLTLSAASAGPWAMSFTRSDLTNADTRLYVPSAGVVSWNQYDTVAAGYVETFRTAIENSGSAFTLLKATAAATNPGGSRGKLYLRDGTNVNTLKLVIRAGTAGAETTILDNIPT